LDSKTEEEVRKRRAKPGPGPLNIYQKVLLLGGLLTVFLVVGRALRMASILWVMVIGAIGVSLLAFFWFKSNRPKRERGKKADLGEAETLSFLEKAADQQEAAPGAEEEVGNREEISPEEKKSTGFEEKLPQELEEVVALERFPEEKEEMAAPEDSPAQEIAVNITKKVLILEEIVGDMQKLLSNLEERVVHIEGALLKLEEKTAHRQEVFLKPEEKVDMQMILSQLAERDQKTL